MAHTAPLAQHLFDVDRRRSERDEVSLHTLMLPLGGQAAAVTLVNLSRLGFMARSETMLNEGARIQVELPLVGAVRARIVWSFGNALGGEFAQPIGEQDYHQIVAMGHAAVDEPAYG